jgi:hypothetical protein
MSPFTHTNHPFTHMDSPFHITGDDKNISTTRARGAPRPFFIFFFSLHQSQRLVSGSGFLFLFSFTALETCVLSISFFIVFTFSFSTTRGASQTSQVCFFISRKSLLVCFYLLLSYSTATRARDTRLEYFWYLYIYLLNK